MIELQAYSQLDRKWSEKVMKPSDLKIGSYGCVMTSVAMAMGNYAYEWDPARLNQELVRHKGYTPDGYLIWDALVRATDGNVYFHERVSTTNKKGKGLYMDSDVAVSKVRRLLDLGQPTCLHVDAQKGDKNPDHFIVAYDYVMDGDAVADFKVIDPGGGRRISFSSRYGEIRDGIYGYVALIGPPIRFPDQSRHAEAGKALWKAAQIAQGINTDVYSREIIDTLL